MIQRTETYRQPDMQAGKIHNVNRTCNHLQGEQSMADTAEAGTPNCRAPPVDLNPIPEQQHVAAEHIQEYPPDVQQPAPDELEAQQPGRQVQQHAGVQQPLQQRQERLHPQQQQTQLRHDAPSWEMGRCAVPAYGEQASVHAVKAEKDCCDAITQIHDVNPQQS